MNILLDDLPEEIDGIPIYSDFREMVMFELMVADPEIPQDGRIPLAIDLLYQQPIRDLKQAMDGLLWFHRCGAPLESGRGGKRAHERAYDFEQDASDIYAAFMQVYHIDLNSAELHWWKFSALLAALPEDCKIMKIMGYRTADISKLKGEEKKTMQHMKNLYRLKPLEVEHLSLAAQEQAMKDRVSARFAEAQRWAAEHKATG